MANAYTVDGVYNIDEQPPLQVQGISTGIWGIVGTFSKGPVNTPTHILSLDDLENIFGGADPSLTGYIGALSAIGQGASEFQVVRIVGSGATAASVTINDSESTSSEVFTATYNSVGTGGNSATITVSSGTKTGTFKLTIEDGDTSEVWDNLATTSTVTGATLLSSITSQIVTFSQPETPNTNLPVNGEYPLSGGANGSTPTVSDYVGTTSPNTGLQALSGTTPAVNIVFLANIACSDSNTVSALETFCENNKCMAAICGAQGNTITQAITETANIDSDRLVYCWPWQQMYVDDLQQTLTVAPTGHWVGLVATLYPHQSPGNKNLAYTSGPEFPVSSDDIQKAMDPSARVVPIGVTIPRGGIGCFSGQTLSQNANPQLRPVYRRRMDDFIVESVETSLGQYVDEPITTTTGGLLDQQQHTVSAFLDPLLGENNEAGEPMIQAYSVQCDTKNNPPSVTDNDMTIIDTRVQLFNMNRFLLFRTTIAAGVVTTTSSVSNS
ncbi:hypothetical protein [Alicyclobacillus acidoterrestris]|uniref:Uncharacterized protein n=1 Tax=Alicyclobacillus acidoterrestris (strain ATCC 49025 / DSM 3922 / CIP 106132 / NCIMB 13137 / GD3B) TaxID=1356854 RepID=T0C3R3_ALIAG|nr:hypothetical protein [Alicyclobacillus acidoterrestris]EPZ47634.1 hypothetical protein N007_05090 [Alicyclobacillus acidoterrestris ATCC 49025]UNO48046.1 hypothetical protein K1I37_15340 [Alicyclobacillus acidoterrestris]